MFFRTLKQDELGIVGEHQAAQSVSTPMSKPVPRSLKQRQRAQANRASHRHDHIGAFVEQGLAQAATVIGALEVAGEQAGLGGRDPSLTPQRWCLYFWL